MKCHLVLPFTAFALLSSAAIPTAGAQERAGRSVEHRKVADGLTIGAVSPDGRYISHAIWTEEYLGLGLRDLTTGEDSRLTERGLPGYPEGSIFSPDGQRLAYSWRYLNKEVGELRSIGADGSYPRVLFQDPEASSVAPLAWSRDGEQILATVQRRGPTSHQLVLISVADGSARVLKSFDWRFPSGGAFSPDGRHIVYDFQPDEEVRQRDIFLISAATEEETIVGQPVVEDPADDRLLGWTPDGRHVLFASDRGGTLGLWAQPLAGGKPQSTPVLLMPALEEELVGGLGFTRDGSYYYGALKWENDVYLTELDPETATLQPPQRLFRYAGYRTSIEWSPDGERLAFVKGSGWDVYSWTLGVWSRQTQEARQLPLLMSRFRGFQPRWSRDGRYLFVQGRDREGRGGIYRVSIGTGALTPVMQVPWTERLLLVGGVSNGKAFVFQLPGPNPIILARDLESGSAAEIYRAEAPGWLPALALSPDGRRVAFVEHRFNPRGTALMVVPAEGGEPRELFRVQHPEFLPAIAWMPDGYTLVFARERLDAETPEFQLWSLSVEGGEPEVLGLGMEGVRLWGLSVHPGGHEIAFTAGGDPDGEVWVIRNFLRDH